MCSSVAALGRRMGALDDKPADSSEVTFDARYNDPTSDMVIRTTDGIHFRVQSYHMKSFSTYFRDMPDFDLPLNGATPKTAIDLECTRTDLATILALHDVDGFSTTSWLNVSSALKAGRQYGFLSLPVHVAAKANRCVPDAPLAVFEFASQHDFYALAKLAISFFHKEPQIYRHLPADYPTAIFKVVPGDYVTALYRAIGPKYMAEHLMYESQWEEISSRFKL